MHNLQTYRLTKGDTYLEFMSFWLTEKEQADITHYSNIVMELRKGPDSESELLRRFAIGQGITPESETEIRIEVPSSETAGWDLGSYYRHIRFYVGTEVYTRAKGMVIVENNLIDNQL